MPLITNETPWFESAKPAFEDIARLRWRRAATTLASLSRQHPKDPQLKLVVARLMMQVGAPPEKIADQFRQYLSTPDLDYVDQVVGHIYRIAHDDLTQDVVQTVHAVFEVDGIDAWLEQLTASKRMVPERVERDPDDDSPPPRALFQVLDREFGENHDDVRQWPRVMGVLVLYGKQTDRPARLELHGLADDLLQVRELLNSLLPLPEPVEEPTLLGAQNVLLQPPAHPNGLRPSLPPEEATQQACLIHFTETLSRTPAGDVRRQDALRSRAGPALAAAGGSLLDHLRNGRVHRPHAASSTILPPRLARHVGRKADDSRGVVGPC